ncbi:MAG: hypothetical protein U9N57_01145 [Pseudomonadota bacterium]|nr:hypothetical protein [Pseudomonadota bacterium]
MLTTLSEEVVEVAQDCTDAIGFLVVGSCLDSANERLQKARIELEEALAVAEMLSDKEPTVFNRIIIKGGIDSATGNPKIVSNLLTIVKLCGMISQSCSKALRFGVTDGYPNRNTTNAEDIIGLLNELSAIAMTTLPKTDSDEWKGPINSKAREAKKVRVVEWMEYAAKQGTLNS